MPVNFKLNSVEEVDPAVDDWSRTWIGWSPTHTPQQT